MQNINQFWINAAWSQIAINQHGLDLFNARCMANYHMSLGVMTNPVLDAFREKKLSSGHMTWVLGQYSFLPAMIVKFLKAGKEELAQSEIWPETASELERNIAEEQGSRTHGQVHFDILCHALSTELGINVQDAGMTEATEKFLVGLARNIVNSEPARTAGIMYALEDSAVPELLVVAEIINRQAGRHVINPHALRSVEKARALVKATFYNLEDFFVLHVQDFEKGHQSPLKGAITGDLSKFGTATHQWTSLKAGYDQTLDSMDQWWEALSQPLPVEA